MNITETLSLLELLIIVMGLPGLTISILLIAVFQGDRGNLRKTGVNGINKRMTNADLRNEILAAYQLAGFVALGLIYSAVPPAAPAAVEAVSIVAYILIISWEVKETLGSIWRFVDRKRNGSSLEALAGQSTDRNEIRDKERDPVRDEARDIGRDPVRDVARDGVHDETIEERDALRDAGRDEGRDLVRDPARDEARDIERDAAVEAAEEK